MHWKYSARHIQTTTTTTTTTELWTTDLTTRTTPASQTIKLPQKPLHGQRALISKFRAAVLAGGRWHSQSRVDARRKSSLDPASLLNKHHTHKDKEHTEPGAGVKCEGRWCRHRHDVRAGIPSARGRFRLPGGGELIAVLSGLFLSFWRHEAIFQRAVDSQSHAQQTG